MTAPFHVVVHAAAPIPVGDEIEVHLITKGEQVFATLVRHVATSVLYGPPEAFDTTPTYDVYGDRELYLSPRPKAGWTVIGRIPGRVRECVVSNVVRSKGYTSPHHAAVTSFLVEHVDKPQAYR